MISMHYIIIRNSKKRETLHFYTAIINNPGPSKIELFGEELGFGLLRKERLEVQGFLAGSGQLAAES